MGTLLAFCFTIFIMHKACTTFQDADGTITIAIFYFQIVALLFKDRAADFGPCHPPPPPITITDLHMPLRGLASISSETGK